MSARSATTASIAVKGVRPGTGPAAPAFPGPARAGSVSPSPSPECGELAVLGRDVRVPLASGGRITYAALDYAASAPALQAVWDDIAAYAPYYGSVHRGAGHLSRLSTELFERSRAEVAAFLGCRDGDQVVFTRSTTDSLNLLASCLPAGTRVFVFETEHHAALLPWGSAGADVTFLDAPRTPDGAVAALERALAVSLDAEGERPRLVCVTGASNVTGELWPVGGLARAARRAGARIVLDAAQLVPHHPVSVTGLDVDWVAFSGHKLYAPFGSGVLAGRADWLREAAPYLAGGGASRTVARTPGGGVAVEWHSAEARHEAGSPNVIGAYAIASACRALAGAGFAGLVEREQRLVARVRDGLAGVPGARVLSLFGDDAPRVGVISFVVGGWDSPDLASALSEEYGIGVRDGLFCAHPLVRALLGGRPDTSAGCGAAPDPGPRAADRGAAGEPDGPGGPAGAPAALGAVRVSFGAGTPEEHLTRFLGAVRELAARGPGRNRRTGG